jgi:hypothetical protein
MSASFWMVLSCVERDLATDPPIVQAVLPNVENLADKLSRMCSNGDNVRQLRPGLDVLICSTYVSVCDTCSSGHVRTHVKTVLPWTRT